MSTTHPTAGTGGLRLVQPGETRSLRSEGREKAADGLRTIAALERLVARHLGGGHWAELRTHLTDHAAHLAGLATELS